MPLWYRHLLSWRCHSCTKVGAKRRNCSPAGVRLAPALFERKAVARAAAQGDGRRALTVVCAKFKRWAALMKLPVESYLYKSPGKLDVHVVIA